MNDNRINLDTSRSEEACASTELKLGLDCQGTDHTSTASPLDTKGRRFAKAAVDHPAAMDLRPTILQALRCLDHDIELSCSACSDLKHFVQLHRNGSAERGRFTGRFAAWSKLAAPSALRKRCCTKL